MTPPTRLIISMDQQTLDLLTEGEPARRFKISTSEKGMGFEEGSFRTPTGRFSICEMIGEGKPLYTRFAARVPVGVWAPGESTEEDLVLSRILRLEGLDPENANTRSRHIYIHGTNREDLIGRPASHGCVRLSNNDMVELFSLVHPGTPVEILPLTKTGQRLLFIDCDSTLSAIEGIDEIARLSNPEIFAEVEAMTNAAMNGEIPLEDVFRRRMEIIRPNKAIVEAVSRQYIDRIVPGAAGFVALAKEQGWLPVILSGGFTPVIQPLARLLGIRHIEAVPLQFNELGEYLGYDEDYPTTRNLGKNEVIRQWKKAMLPKQVVMIGDGVSDLETKSDVDLMVGFGGVAQREKVRKSADAWWDDFSDLEKMKSVLG
jgi:HAD superfamily phosphoserine phosphatase-like hydrolase